MRPWQYRPRATLGDKHWSRCGQRATAVNAAVVRRVRKAARPDPSQSERTVLSQDWVAHVRLALLLAGSHEAIHDPRQVEQLIRRGPAKWGKLSAAERLMTKEVFAKAVAELSEVDGKSQFPQDGLVLRVICGDLPRSPQPSTSPSRNAYNQDYAWFRKGEARAFLPEQPIPGAKEKVRRDL